MKRYWKTALVTCAALGIGLIAWQLLSTREPSYNGKPLTYWLGGDDPPHGLLSETEDAREDARAAIRRMGSRCAPYLTRMIGKYAPVPDVPLQWTHVYSRYRKSRLEKWFDKRYSKTFHAREKAEEAFEILGPLAAPAVPDLVRLLEHKNEEIRTSAAKVLGFIGPGAEQAVPALAKHLNDVWVPVKDGYAYHDAISFFSEAALNAIPHSSALEVPTLIENLRKPTHPESSRRCLIRLEHAGAAGQAAAPVVKPFLNDINPDVRIAAKKCLRAITPNARQE